jgi:hypothetical protein
MHTAVLVLLLGAASPDDDQPSSALMIGLDGAAVSGWHVSGVLGRIRLGWRFGARDRFGLVPEIAFDGTQLWFEHGRELTYDNITIWRLLAGVRLESRPVGRLSAWVTLRAGYGRWIESGPGCKIDIDVCSDPIPFPALEANPGVDVELVDGVRLGIFGGVTFPLLGYGGISLTGAWW